MNIVEEYEVALNDVIELKVRGVCQGVVTLNIFHYQVISAAANPTQDLINAARWLTSTVLGGVISLTGVDTSFTLVEAMYVVGGPELHLENIALAGTAVVSPYPPFVTVGFRYGRATASGRNGYKRFSGLVETLASGRFIDAATMPFVAIIAATMAADLTDPGGELAGIYRPVIVSKVLNGQTRPIPIAQPISGVTGLRQLGSQNTRKN